MHPDHAPAEVKRAHPQRRLGDARRHLVADAVRDVDGLAGPLLECGEVLEQAPFGLVPPVILATDPERSEAERAVLRRHHQSARRSHGPQQSQGIGPSGRRWPARH